MHLQTLISCRNDSWTWRKAAHIWGKVLNANLQPFKQCYTVDGFRLTSKSFLGMSGFIDLCSLRALPLTNTTKLCVQAEGENITKTVKYQSWSWFIFTIFDFYLVKKRFREAENASTFWSHYFFKVRMSVDSWRDCTWQPRWRTDESERTVTTLTHTHTQCVSAGAGLHIAHIMTVWVGITTRYLIETETTSLLSHKDGLGAAKTCIQDWNVYNPAYREEPPVN